MAGEEAWIAVIRRGGCTFNEKIRNVLALNASGVLIYDNEGSSGEPQPFNLGSKSPHKITIYRARNKGLYVVARNFFLLLLNCSAWPCLGVA